MKYDNIREEELKNKVAQDLFLDFDCRQIIRDIDFCAAKKQGKKQASPYSMPKPSATTSL